jgi:hypothetical protein
MFYLTAVLRGDRKEYNFILYALANPVANYGKRTRLIGSTPTASIRARQK